MIPLALWALVLGGPAGGERWRPPELTVAAPPPLLSFAELERAALGYLGRPYITGGVGSPGFDCSGLTCRIFAEAGYAIPRVSRDQARAGRPIPLGSIAPGDLLFFAEPGDPRIRHVGLYLGDGELLHAASGLGRVVVSPLSQRWYRDRLVLARRFLPEPGATLTSSVGPWRGTDAAPLELVEHSGETALSPFLRLDDALMPPELGPDIEGPRGTAIGLSALVASERRPRAAGGTESLYAFVLVPEATLLIDSLALEVSVAVPIRFEPGSAPSVGTFERAADVLRFLRGASLGLRGAELELRLTRFGDASLGGGLVVSRLDPGSMASGIQGLSIGRSPLSLVGGYRGASLELGLLVDDIADPGVFGASFAVPVVQGWLRLGATLATDQRAELASLAAAGRRAITVAEAIATLEAVKTPTLELSVSAAGALERASGAFGFGARGRAQLEWTFSRGKSQSLIVALEGGVQGERFLGELFGPTYLIHRPQTYVGLRAARTRATLGGELSLRLGSVVVSAGYADAPSERRSELDRRLFGLLELKDLRLGGSWYLDLRLAYAARGLGGPEVMDVLHGGARLKLSSWLWADVYAAKTEGFELGAGVGVAWIP